MQRGIFLITDGVASQPGNTLAITRLTTLMA
jgi:hypothetical protein